jgi:hypothetical protein
MDGTKQNGILKGDQRLLSLKIKFNFKPFRTTSQALSVIFKNEALLQASDQLLKLNFTSSLTKSFPNIKLYFKHN